MDSLEEICLQEITVNFDEYSVWYAKSEGTVYAKQFEFLRRVYSDTIFSRLLDDIEEQYLHLLINPYLKNLDIRHIDKKLIRSIANKLKTHGNGIQTIKARFSKLLYEQLIPSSSHLVDIEIGGFRGTRASSIYGIYTSEMIKSLGKHCPELRVLKLRDDEADLYSSGQCILSEESELCPELYKAVCYLLDRCPSLEILGNINTVEILYKRHKLDLENGDLQKCRKYSLTKLSFLDGRNYPLLDAFKICHSLCPKITCFELHWINGKQLVRCPDFMTFQDVKILFGNATIGDMNQFLKIRGSKLVNLELYHPYISVQTLIRCCPELKHLTLSSVEKFKPVKQCDFSLSATGFPKLKSFFIDQTGFSQKKSRDAVKLIISSAKKLETVHFRSMRGFSEVFCNSLFELGFHRVRELDVGRTDIPLTFLIKLLSEGSIENMNVWHCTHISSDNDRDTLLRFKQGNQAVKVTCWDDLDEELFYGYSYDEWEFHDRCLYSGSDFDSDLESDSDSDLEEWIHLVNAIHLLTTLNSDSDNDDYWF